jgi:oxygen tolerance protein BatD
VRAAPAVFVAGALCCAALTTVSNARAEVSLSTSLSARKVEAGAQFTLQLRVSTSAGEEIGAPDLKLPVGISASRPNVGRQSQISIVNGQMTQSIGISATWGLVASRPGTYQLGPASVQTSDGLKSDRAVTIEVVPPGSLPPPPLAGQPLDPFNMLRGMGMPGLPGFPGFPGDDAPATPQLPELPEEFKIGHALDPLAFLRARAVPRKVVVGEQVTLSVYAYAGRGSFEPGVMTEPSRDDFLAFNLMEDAHQLTGYQFELDGQRWLTAKIAQFALFPLKAGKLKAGEMSLCFVGRGYSKDPKGLKRTSLPVEIDVVEPPLNGRPPGYHVGDVGHYDLTAQVEPREVPAGGSISIVAKLEGTGNLPFTLVAPERNGVHFLEPQLVEQVAAKHGEVQGFRSFTYVVELSQPGEQDLGELTLPYWDAKARSYGVARAALGKVKVTGTAKPPVDTATPGTPQSGHFKNLLTPAAKLGSEASASASASYWPSRPGYWLMLIGLPLTAFLGFALADLAKLLGSRMSARRGSLATAQEQALSQLTSAVRAGDAAASANAAERALFVAIERATLLKARGVLKKDLPARLTQAGVRRELAERAAELLGRCDELRFAGEAVDLAALSAEVREVCQQFGAQSGRTKSGVVA